MPNILVTTETSLLDPFHPYRESSIFASPVSFDRSLLGRHVAFNGPGDEIGIRFKTIDGVSGVQETFTLDSGGTFVLERRFDLRNLQITTTFLQRF